MRELRWFDLTPPRDIDLADVTTLLRPLAHRPKVGWTYSTPLVVFELWGENGRVGWRLGVDARIVGQIAEAFHAHLPRLGMAASTSHRQSLHLAADVRLSTLAATLRSDTAGAIGTQLGEVLSHLSKGEAASLQWVLGPAQPSERPPSPLSLAEAMGFRAPSVGDSRESRSWQLKAAEALFAVQGRIGASAESPQRARGIIQRIGSAVKLANSQHAALMMSRASEARARRINKPTGSALRWSCLLNADELAALLGWPVQDTPSESLPVTGGHINEVPAKLLVDEREAATSKQRVLGESLHPVQRGRLVTVPPGTSLHHLHLIGPTGSGKSTLLCGLSLADIAAGRSVLVVDPRGDLVRDILARIPAKSRKDVVVIDPASERSVGINVLGGDRGQAERRADQIVHLLSEMHGTNFGPRTTDVALHALIAASRLKDGTICDVPMLLTNPSFRRRVLREVGDPLTLAPFFAWFDGLSEGERAQVIAPLLNKLRALTSRETTRRMLGQATPKFDLEELFTKRRIVLVNLNRGLLGAPAANLLGALLLSQVWSAAQRRAAVPDEKRHPVMMVVDEFQDYLRLSGGLDFGEALAQSRGLGVGWTLAHQHLGQLNANQRAAVLANARSRVVFRPATDDAKPLASSLGGDLTGDDLLRLRAFQACAQLLLDRRPTMPFSVQTQPLPPWTSDPNELRRESERRYGVDGAELDKAQLARWEGGDLPPVGPIGTKPRRSA
ncbi:type IV secretory system conjugative DNA transfer family protein [Glycomyces salinus]|uniref:type IV secretory system conjugative DNA transfer family protein n=1 Tax=Glycomyces salinus TaxID=980294 RepID=UPI0018EB9808|nr:type IV secretory system conjugative DNA transfer family protein [Glycomyces salinus]